MAIFPKETLLSHIFVGGNLTLIGSAELDQSVFKNWPKIILKTSVLQRDGIAIIRCSKVKVFSHRIRPAARHALRRIQCDKNLKPECVVVV